jgi:hypothetical protein
VTDERVWQEIRSHVDVRLRAAGLSWYCIDERIDSQMHSMATTSLSDFLDRYASVVETVVMSAVWEQGKEEHDE